MSTMKSHKLHEHYSAKNPVPTVSLMAVAEDVADQLHLRRGKGRRKQKQGGVDENVQEEDQKEDAEIVSEEDRGEEVEVKDPVTGDDVFIRHANQEVDPSSKGENILSQEFPPPDWCEHRNRIVSIAVQCLIYLSCAYALSALLTPLLPIPSSAHPFLRALASLLAPTSFAYVLVFRLRNGADEDFDHRLWNAERERGWRGGKDRDRSGKVEGAERFRESAEWANSVVRGVWPIINPDMFSSMIDMLEDIMQSSIPRFVHSVRVSDFGLGLIPMRITAIRSMPDADVQDALEGVDEKDRDLLGAEHVNLEVSFAYRAQPSGATIETKAHNAHLQLEFFLGLRGVWGTSVPIWVEITGVAGTARTRIQLIPDPPFLKTTLVTLMGVPNVSLSVVPMSEHLPNVMNIPGLSNFITKSINAAAAEYVAPKSLVLDLQQLISGDDIKKDTTNMGVLVVHIHRAVGIKKMDNTDRSPADPYVTLTFSKQGKPLFSTRIIEGDLNPVWEETAMVPVDPSTVKIRENLSLQLWDSDRASADDMMGYVEIDILDLIRNKNKPVRKRTPLASPDSDDRPGTLEYTVGYYGKLPPNAALATDGSDPAVPADLKDEPAFKDAKAKALNDAEAAVLTCPPDPEWPTGILSVQVHEIMDLMVKTFGRKKKGAKEPGEKGQDDDDTGQEQGEGLPSSYCCIEINDELVYSTRVKPVTSSPIFNAGTERLVRDWRKSHVVVVVRDSRMRENDPVLGMVFLKLSDLLVNASQVTRFYPIEQGVGAGRVRVSVLFRPIQAKLPPNLLGFDTGTIVLRNVTVQADEKHAADLSKCKLGMKTYTSSAKMSRNTADTKEDGSIVWHAEESSEIPVQKRYSSALYIAFRSSVVLTPSKRQALAVLWLSDLVDNEESRVQVALWQSEDYSRLKHNYVPPSGDISDWDKDKEKMHRIGTVEIDLTFRPGVTSAHESVLNVKDKNSKQKWDEFDRRDAAGWTESVGQGDGAAFQGTEEGRSSGSWGSNTEIDPEEVQEDEFDARGKTDERDWDGDGDGVRTDEEDAKGGRGNKLVRKWKASRKHGHELHREHLGAMQVKPARTAVWLKDNVENAAHKVGSTFKQQAREPDVETEV